LGQPIDRTSWSVGAAFSLGFLLLGIGAVFAMGEKALLPVLGMGAAVVLLASLIHRPELGILAFAALLYSNSPVNLGRIAASPQVLGLVATALLAVSVLVEVYVKRRGWIVDHAFLMMVALVGVAVLSTLLSTYPQTGLSWIITLITEGVIVYLFVINAIRRITTLKRILWVLLAVCAVMSAMGAYQELTGSYEQSFLGFAQRNTERGLGDRASEGDGLIRSRSRLHSVYRARGPMGDPNRFGQVLLVLVPLGAILASGSGRGRERLMAAACTGAILVGVFLTYSRGTMLMLAAIGAGLVLLGCLRTRDLAFGAVTAVIVVAIAAPGMTRRLDSIRGVQSLFSEESAVEADGATTGRMTEMLAALHAFRDHPLLGLGPGNYTPHYSVQYMSNPEIAFRIRDTQRRAHSLYIELAAEMGIVGLLVFLAIPAWLALRLWRLRAYWVHRDRERATLASAFLLALVAYLGTAVFLHLAFQRYYWFLIGLVGASVQLLSQPGAHATGSIVNEPVDGPLSKPLNNPLLADGSSGRIARDQTISEDTIRNRDGKRVVPRAWDE
jgi:hypothetical protein